MVSKLLSPSMPMIADYVYRHLVVSVDASQPESVHLGEWPAYDADLIDLTALHDMALAQKLVSLGRAARESVEIGVRQPLASVQFVTRGRAEAQAVDKLRDVIASELNVKQVSTGGAEGAISYKLNPLPQALGKKFGKDFPRVQRAMREGDADRVREWAVALLNGETITVGVDGDAYIVTPEECQVMQGAAEGYAVAEDAGLVAVLDTRLNDDLLKEGLAREVVRRVQATRRDAGFEIEDRIHLVYDAGDNLAQAIERFADSICEEVLALSIARSEVNGDFFRADFLPNDDPKQDASIRGEALRIGVKKA
jgi:isoleucyl-tRNA synthetase